MTVILSSLNEGQAVTIINIFIAVIQYTLPLLLVILLVQFMPKTNNALAWNSISQTLHSSLWPTLLRTDSSRSTGSGAIVSTIAYLFRVSMILLPISKVVLPLGLHDGPFRPSSLNQLDARYVPDTSALRLATSPHRNLFKHGSKCTPGDVGCDTNNITANISPLLNEMFNSTPHSPFSIQYRRFLNIDGQAASIGYPGSAATFLMRNDSFVAEGVVIDMSSAHPGVGFINHTIPTVSAAQSQAEDGIVNGGTWSQDVLFLEPVTSCVDTNLTIEYVLSSIVNINGATLRIANYTIIDRGGFVDHPGGPIIAYSTYDGEFDLRKHAYNGAVVATTVIMLNLNMTTESYMNKAYPVFSTPTDDPFPIYLGRMTPFPLEVLPRRDYDGKPQGVWQQFLRFACSGIAGGDPMDINKVHVSCGMFLGPPLRTDGGENNVFEPGSKWFQSLHTCAGATRASIQTVTFAIGSFRDSSTANLTAIRNLDRPNVLWAVEKQNETILDAVPLWGRVDERYSEVDQSSFWAVRSDSLLLPANSGTLVHARFPEGSPQNAHATIWTWINAPLIIGDVAPSITDYTAGTDFAMRKKFENIIAENSPAVGAETVMKLMWTDMLANQLVGTATNDTLFASVYMHSLDYDFRFPITGYLLGFIWLPVFLSAISLLVLGKMKFTYLKDAYNHLSIGRVVTNTSALRIQSRMASDRELLPSEKQLEGRTEENRNWAKSDGRTQVTMVLEHKGPQSETVRLMPRQSFLDEQ